MTKPRDWNGVQVIPADCACCKRCWMRIDGRYKGYCIYGGPYTGFIQEAYNAPQAASKISACPVPAAS